MSVDRTNFAAWLEAYRRCRSRTTELNDRLVRRLAGELGIRLDTQPSTSSRRVRAGWLSGTKSLSPIALARQMWREARMLSRALSSAASVRTVLVIADTRRLGLAVNHRGLTRLCRPFDGSESLDTLLPSDANILIFSPNLFPIERADQGPDWPLIGYLGLPWIVALHPIRAVRALLNRRVNGASAFWAVLGQALDDLISDCAIDEVVMLTSNSYAIELLRWRLMNAGRIGSIAEILHGIPTTEMVEYFEWCEANAVGCGMRFVGPVPRLSFDRDGNGGMSLMAGSINLKMNEYIVERSRDDVARAIGEYRRMGRGGFIVSLNGCASGGMPYFESPHFALESTLLAAIRDFSIDVGVPIDISYSVHPAHVKSGLAREFAGRLPGVTILLDSVIGWLAADLCVALMSSSMWDARALGCPTFIAVREDDDLYDAALLSDDEHIAAPEQVDTALRRVLGAMADRGLLSDAAIEERVRRLYRDQPEP